MSRIIKDENGEYLPVKTEIAPAEKLPTAAQQRPKKADGTAHTEDENKDRGKPIGREEVAKAKSTLKEYLNDKKIYDTRYKNNYDTYNLMYNENTPYRQTEIGGDGKQHFRLIERRLGGQTLNVIMNKHADAMDNYPEPIFLPREPDDEKTAQMLGSIVPCILERNNFQKTYSEHWRDKLVGGVGVYSVTWDSERERGLGDIAINRVNVLSMAWEPYIEDIQDSANVFVVRYIDVDEAKEAYPELKNASVEDLGLEGYTTYDAETETRNKAAMIDWYYKRDGMLHLCQFCGETVIFASENEPENYPNGFYEHGKYPFVMGPLFPLRNTPVGFSFVDICRGPQMCLDDLKRDILKNVKVNSQTRNLYNSNAIANPDDLSDLSKEFIESDAQNLRDLVLPLETKDIAGGALSMYQALTDEIKQITGTNDASNGASAAGVTSGSAIAALQEAGGKISRDINKGGFQEFSQLCELIIELIRQFYRPARWFRIVGEDKKVSYEQFGNDELMPQPVKVEGSDKDYQRLPVFDIEVKAQRSNPFTTAANNQMMVDMFNMGAFEPGRADAALAMLECMSFEGKDKLVEIIKKNQTLQQMVMDLQGKVEMSNAMLAQQAAQGIGEEMPLPANQSEGAKI